MAILRVNSTQVASLQQSGVDKNDFLAGGVSRPYRLDPKKSLERFAIACMETATGSTGRHGEKKVKSHCST
jgi:hypothetical protein